MAKVKLLKWLKTSSNYEFYEFYVIIIELVGGPIQPFHCSNKPNDEVFSVGNMKSFFDNFLNFVN